ncbi:MAG: sulfatase-like hydrolase/transferase, partial [Pirellulaceae bacterium]
MTKHTFVLILVTILLGSLSTTRSLPAADKPNVVIFVSDDQGWGDLSGNGNRTLSTPRIDELARQGARFDRFYVCP